MSTTAASPVGFALGPGEGEAIWFLGTLATIKASEASTGGHLSLIEHVAPPGFGSPLHVHRREDEWFYVLEGELTVWVGGEVVVAPAGSFVYGPRGVPHTFAITSAGPARFLLATQPAGLDGFVRELGAPARARALPTSAELPDPERLAAAAARHGIDILGPPGIPS